MVTVKPASPVGALSALTADQVALTVSYKEQYRRPKKCRKSTPIQTAVNYTTGELKLSGNSIFVPLIATVTAVYLHCNGCTTSKTYTETFDIAFQGQDITSTTATITRYGTISDVSTSDCGVTTLLVDDSIVVAIS